MSSRRQRSILLVGRYRQVSLYINFRNVVPSSRFLTHLLCFEIFLSCLRRIKYIYTVTSYFLVDLRDEVMVKNAGNIDNFTNDVSPRNSNSMDNLSQCNFIAGCYIATKFCIWHNNTVAVPYSKLYRDHDNTTSMRAEWNVHRIWVAMAEPVV